MSNLEKLANKESIKKFGASPFAKKHNQAVEQITTKIDRNKQKKLKKIAVLNDMTLYDLIDEMLDDGIKKYSSKK